MGFVFEIYLFKNEFLFIWQLPDGFMQHFTVAMLYELVKGIFIFVFNPDVFNIETVFTMVITDPILMMTGSLT